MSNENVAPSSAPDFTTVDPSSADQYELVSEIAHGGMATVFLGRLVRSHGFRRPVAIKRMHRHLAAEASFRAMFVQETLLVSKIRHPNVVPMLDIVARENELLAVMELVDGAPLTDVAKAHGRALPPRIAAAIVHDVLCGLHAAHELRDDDGAHLEVIHRDVSPSNILVGSDGMARILDFGVAKALGRSKSTLTGTIHGKMRYMAPEQLIASPVLRPSADVFAAGVVLWELLTGRRLFTSARGLTCGDEQARVVPASVVCPEAAVLDAVVLRATASDPADRFDSALEMARALEDVLAPAGRLDVAEFVADLPLPTRDRVRRLVRDYETSAVHVECSLASARTRPRIRSFFPTHHRDAREAEPQTTTRELAARWAPRRLTLTTRVALGLGILLPLTLLSATAFSSSKQAPHREPDAASRPLVAPAPTPAPSPPPSAWLGHPPDSAPSPSPEPAKKARDAASKRSSESRATHRRSTRGPETLRERQDQAAENLLRAALAADRPAVRGRVSAPSGSPRLF